MSIYNAEFFAGRSETVALSVVHAVPPIVELLHPKSVLDVGCGQGEWTFGFMAAGVEDVIGVDIYPPDLMWFMRRDLTEPLHLKRWFDLVLCLEVGEHLPADTADTLVDSLVRHGDRVVFSAAVPGQEGKGHINCQPHDYWHAKFEERGYRTLDTLRPLLQDHRVSAWYRNNMFLYERDGR